MVVACLAWFWLVIRWLPCCCGYFAAIASQDRLVVCPRVMGRDDISIMCVFDGTVGDHAADYCHEFFPANLAATPDFAEAVAATDKGDTDASMAAMSKALTKVRQHC